MDVDGQEEASEGDLDDVKDDYRPKGPPAATVNKSDASRSTGTRSGGITDGAGSRKRTSDTNKQSRSGTEKRRNDIAGDDMEIDDDAEEEHRGDDRPHNGAPQRAQAEEDDEEEEEEYTQKEPIDLQ